MPKLRNINLVMCGVPKRSLRLVRRTIALLKHTESSGNSGQIDATRCLDRNAAEGVTTSLNSTHRDQQGHTGPERIDTDHETRQADAPVLLDRRNLAILKAAVLAGRELQVEAANVRMNIEKCREKLSRLNRAIVDLDRRAEEFNIAGTTSEKARRPGMLRQIDRMRDKRNELNQQLRDLENVLKEVYESYEVDQDILLPELDDMLVRSKLLPPPTEIVVPEVVDDSDSVDEVLSDKLEKGRPVVSREGSPEKDHSQPSSSHTLKRKAKVEELRKVLLSSDEYAFDIKEDLLRIYRFNRICLAQAEADLEERHEKFYAERDEIVEKRNAGIKTESLTQLGLRQFQETQRLTRAVADAEEKFYAAKNAAIHGDVALAAYDDDQASGFVDDVEDGYRLSEEREIMAHTDHTIIHLWLDDVPTTLAESCTSELVEESGAIGVEMDSWEVKSVEIGVSWSVIAAGSERRRIDRWTMACGMENWRMEGEEMES